MNFNNRLVLSFVAPAILFVAGLAGSIWALARTQADFDNYIQTEQAVANGVTEMYAQGLQMGQALRNILLDPANPKAYENLDAARLAFETVHTATLASARGTPAEPGLAPLAALRGRKQRPRTRCCSRSSWMFRRRSPCSTRKRPLPGARCAPSCSN